MLIYINLSRNIEMTLIKDNTKMRKDYKNGGDHVKNKHTNKNTSYKRKL